MFDYYTNVSSMSCVRKLTRTIQRQWDLYMEGMSLKFALVIARRFLGHLSMFGYMAGTSWTHS